MIYLDIIATDTENCIETMATKDHNFLGLKDIVKKPKVSLWQLWNIKKFIEKSYEKLERERSERIVKGVEVGDFSEAEAKKHALQVSARDNGQEVVGKGRNLVDGLSKPKPELGANKG